MYICIYVYIWSPVLFIYSETVRGAMSSYHFDVPSGINNN